MRPAVRRGAILLVAVAVGLAGGASMGLLAQGQPLPVVIQPRSVEPEKLPEARPLTPDTLLAWTPGGLPSGFADSIGRLPGIDHVVPVVSGTAWLTRSFGSDGTAVDRPPPGLAIPIEVAGADLADYAPFLSPVDRSILPQLARGQAALGATERELRPVDAGGTLVFGASRIRVAGVLPDTAIGAHEIFVSRATAGSLGITRERYVLIDPAPAASRERLTRRIVDLLPAGALIRIRGPGETPYFRQGDAVLPQVKIKEAFGEFAARPIPGGTISVDPRWAARHIVTASVPILGAVRCNRALIPQLRGALEEVAGEGLTELIDPSSYGGCYSARFINRNASSGTLSHHSWGAAVDINVAANAFGQTPHQDPRLVAIFRRWGFTWGGTWVLPDGMHFEFVRFATGL